jgi:GTP pyrophosphokinase
MTDEMKKAVGRRIRAARKAKGLSQEELGAKLGISFQAVSTWETGKFMPDADHLPALAKELDLSLDALFAEGDRQWSLRRVNFDPDHMFTYVKSKAQERGYRQTLAVMDLLRDAHAKQKRRSKYGFECPYIAHPLTMACHALAMGLKGDDLLAACIAHDMVEDADMKPDDLPVGETVRAAVRLVSKNLVKWSPDWEDKYYDAIRKNSLACMVKVLDRIHNVAGMADAYGREWMTRYVRETDRYYPELLDAVKKVPEWNNAAWLLRYQLNTMIETFKRML